MRDVKVDAETPQLQVGQHAFPLCQSGRLLELLQDELGDVLVPVVEAAPNLGAVLSGYTVALHGPEYEGKLKPPCTDIYTVATQDVIWNFWL